MASVAEALENAQTQLATALAAGVENISYNQTVTFDKYVKVVLPLDGFVFWVKADQLSDSALFNAGAFNAQAFNGQPDAAVVVPANTMTVKGSIHYQTENHQDADANYSVNRVVFTSEQEIEDLSAVSPTVSFIGMFEGVRFQFSKRSNYYQQSGLHHYVGDAIYSTLDSQIIDNPALLDTQNVVVSNSLPIWLALNKYMPVYPAFLVPENLPPPYASVYIDPNSTTALQTIPHEDADSNSWQLMRERVRITFYGCRNYTVQDYLRYVLAQSRDYDNFGLMSMPAIRDEHQGQVEMSALAQKKVLDLEISYYQTRVRDIARQLILHAFCAVTVGT